MALYNLHKRHDRNVHFIPKILCNAMVMYEHVYDYVHLRHFCNFQTESGESITDEP